MKIEYENLQKVNKKIFKNYKKSFEDFLDSGWYVLGQNVSKFEKEFAQYINCSYCTGVASGLDALIIALDSYSFPKGSEVLVPSNTYIASILAIIRCGLKPILIEPNVKSYNIDINKIEEKINSRTVAILVVHLYGKPCEMDKIIEISGNHGLKVIEDCAQAHGAKYKNKTVGTFGIGCFSFYPTKNLGALGDGGAICTNEEQIDKKVKSLRNYGSTKKYYNDYIGYNSRLDEIQASFLAIKLRILDDITSHKRELADLYNKYLSEKYIKPLLHDDTFDVYHIYNIRISNRDKLKEYLFDNGIKTEIHYPIPPHKQKALKGFFNEPYPISDLIHSTTLSLPISYFHSKGEIIKVIEILNKYISKK